MARFHLANGARLERLNWIGDTSVTGLQRSLGLMVNYVYRLAESRRTTKHTRRSTKVIASPDIERLARRAAQ